MIAQYVENCFLEQVCLQDVEKNCNLQNLKRLQKDSEKQLLEFNEIIPIEHNPNDVYSPKLVNLMLNVGPQIENVTDIILKKLNIESEKGGIPSKIKALNGDGILSSFTITAITNDLQYTPFTQEYDWWNTYNNTKHDLSEAQFKITYLTVMNSLSALSGLHRLADVVVRCDDEYKNYVLERKHWKNTMDYLGNNPITQSKLQQMIPPSWKSILFKIHNYFVYLHDT